MALREVLLAVSLELELVVLLVVSLVQAARRALRLRRLTNLISLFSSQCTHNLIMAPKFCIPSIFLDNYQFPYVFYDFTLI
jgi:hypothetical protein